MKNAVREYNAFEKSWFLSFKELKEVSHAITKTMITRGTTLK